MHTTGRALLHKHKGEYDQAIADYTEIIRLNPGDYDACYNRGLIYDLKGDDDKAIADFTGAVRLKPDYAYAYNDRGWAYAKKGDDDKAIADFTEVIRLKPGYADAYNSRGAAYERGPNGQSGSRLRRSQAAWRKNEMKNPGCNRVSSMARWAMLAGKPLASFSIRGLATRPFPTSMPAMPMHSKPVGAWPWFKSRPMASLYIQRPRTWPLSPTLAEARSSRNIATPRPSTRLARWSGQSVAEHAG